MNPHISMSFQNGTGIVTLNRPQALNSISLDIIRTLTNILSAWQSTTAIRGIVVRGGDSKAFCAGGDLRFFYEAHSAGSTVDKTSLESFFTEEYALNHLIHHFPKPYIAILNGIVMGGGMGISQSNADVRINIVTEHTRMAMPEVSIGLFPDVGGGYFLSRLPDEIGTYLGLTGEVIGAADALFVGLADVFIPGSKLPALYAALKTDGNGNYRSLITRFSKPYTRQIDIARCTLAQHRELIRHHFSKESVQSIIESLKQDPHPFAKRTAETMLKRSPLMLCVTLEQLRRAKTIPFSDCLRMERTMMHHCFEHGDVMEGIRAAIIEKDNQPRWQPASLKEVTDEMIARFFEPVWPDHAHPLIGLK